MPRLVKLDDADKKALGQQIADAWIDDNVDREVWLTDLTRWIHAYQGRMESKNTPWPGASNLWVPLTATHVDAIHPREMAALCQPDPICSFAAQEPSDEMLARKRERFLDWAVREEIDLFPTLDRIILGKDINGVQFVKTTWELKTRRLVSVHEFPGDMIAQDVIQAVVKGDQKFLEAVQRVSGPLDPKVQKLLDDREIELEVRQERGKIIVTTEREEVVRDAPRVTLLDPEDVVVNSDATYDLQEADHVLHRYWMTPKEIKRAVARGTYQASKDELETIERLATTERMPSDDNTLDIKERRDDITGTASTFRQGDPERLELLDWYGEYDINDDGEDESVIVTIVREQPDLVLRVVRLEEVYRHGMRPFVAFYHAPVGNAFWAIGIPQILEGIQAELNIIHNQRVDAGTISNTPWGWYVPAAGFNPEKMPIEPGFLMPVDDVNRVKMHAPANYTAWGFQEEASLVGIAERRTKVSDLTLGRIGEDQGAARTASGVKALSAQQATGFDIIIRRDQDAFKRLLQQILGLYAQYMPPAKEVRVLGRYPEDGDMLVSREDLRGQMDMRFTGNSLSTDREIERQVLTFLAQGVMNPQALQFLLTLGITAPPGVAEWYRHLLDVFDVPRLERIIKIPPPQSLLNVDEIVNRTIAGERLTPSPGEDHQGVMQAIAALLQGPDVVGFAPETLAALTEQLQRRQQQAQVEMMQQMIQQQMMMLQAPQAPQIGAPPAGSSGPPVPPSPLPSAAAAPPPGIGRQPVFAR
jgi:hypothetical protein